MDSGKNRSESVAAFVVTRGVVEGFEQAAYMSDGVSVVTLSEMDDCLRLPRSRRDNVGRRGISETTVTYEREDLALNDAKMGDCGVLHHFWFWGILT